MTLTTSLWGYWRFENTPGTDLIDSSGNNRTLAFGGNVNYLTRVPGVVDYATKFKYVGGLQANFTWLGPEIWYNTPASFSFWVYIHNTDPGGFGACHINFNASAATRIVFVTSAVGFNTIEYDADFGGSPMLNSAPSAMSSDAWHHVAVTTDGHQAYLYLDGEEIDSFYRSGLLGTGYFLNNKVFVDSGNITDSDYYCIFDEFGMWTRALTADEVLRLYNNGSGVNVMAAGGEANATLVYSTDIIGDQSAWFYDKYFPGTQCHYGEEGSGEHRILCGGVDGNIYQLTGTSDNSTDIPCAVRTPARDFGDPRFHKLYGDVLLDCDTNNTNLTVTPYTNNFVTAGLTTTVNNAARTKVPVQLSSTGWVSGRNVGLDITWDVNGTHPYLYAWEPRFTEESAKVLAYSWETCWITHELPGFFYHGYLYVVHVSTADLTFEILNPDSTAAATVTIPNSGGTNYAKSFIRLPIVKGKIFKYKISSTAQFRLSGDESELLVKPWGMGGEWKHEKIFQDASNGE